MISALSFAPDVNDWLALTQHPRILHVFDHTCNLTNKRREVLSIVTPQIGNGPFNIVVEEGGVFSEQFSLETQVSLSPTELTLGDFTVNIADGLLWNPRPDWEQLHGWRIDILHQLASFTIPDRKISIPSLLLSSFTTAIVTADVSAAITTSRKLAGLGNGLTPAGDDFMMGAILAGWIIHPRGVASVLARKITDTAVPLTTSLSAAWLRSAARGHAGILWHDLFDACISADKMALQEAVDNILDIGHTSGADAWEGFLSVFNSCAEKK